MAAMIGASTGAVMRDHDVEERTSTPLELLFDLCFVVAVAVLATDLHHGLAGGHPLAALTTYALLFVPIWWAWMSYTWFATAFSHDDTVTRLLTFAQMAGILAVAAALPSAAHGKLTLFAVAYSAMRLPLIVQWLRSAHADPVHRSFALAYAFGSIVAQALWLIGAFAGGRAAGVIFTIAMAAEFATPVLAVRRSPDRVFHAGHIAERYGLFTIIVLGETILAVSTGFGEVIEDGITVELLVIVTAGLVIAAALWWSYFDTLSTAALTRHRAAAFAWGYGHYAIFASIAAVGAGIRAEIDHPNSGVGAMVVAGACAITLVTLALLARAADPTDPTRHILVGALALVGLAALSAVAPATVVLVGVSIVLIAAAASGRIGPNPAR